MNDELLPPIPAVHEDGGVDVRIAPCTKISSLSKSGAVSLQQSTSVLTSLDNTLNGPGSSASSLSLPTAESSERQRYVGVFSQTYVLYLDPIHRSGLALNAERFDVHHSQINSIGGNQISISIDSYERLGEGHLPLSSQDSYPCSRKPGPPIVQLCLFYGHVPQFICMSTDSPHALLPSQELWNGKGYRFYSANNHGRTVAVRTFHGVRAKEVRLSLILDFISANSPYKRWSATLAFNQHKMSDYFPSGFNYIAEMSFQQASQSSSYNWDLSARFK